MAAVVEMMKKFVENFDHSKFGYNFDPNCVAVTYYTHLQSPSSLILIVEDEGKAIGTMAVTEVPWICDFTQVQLVEVWLWVDIEYRGKGVDRMLFNEIEKRAKGYFSINLAAINGERAKAIGRYYEKKGFLPTETTYVKRL